MASNTLFTPSSINEFVNVGVHFDGLYATGTVTAGQTSNIDLKMNDDMLLTGGLLLAKGGVFGDTVAAQVVDVDNILGLGAGAVLNQFVSWILPDSPVSMQLEVPYPSKIIAGLYLRLAYTSIGATNVQVGVNYMTHKVLI
jgi:hypothetical protein